VLTVKPTVDEGKDAEKLRTFPFIAVGLVAKSKVATALNAGD
jgi:hypothetical protein